MPGTTVPTMGGGVGGNVGGIGSTNPSIGGMPGGGDGTSGTGGVGTAGSNVPSVIPDSGPTLGGPVANIGSMSGPPTVMGNRRVSDAGETLSGAPRATGLPGVMLWATPTASGTLTAMGKNFSLESGMQMTLGVISR
jgi:hypothetical protein